MIVKGHIMGSVFSSILIAVFEAFLYTFTMLGVTPRNRRYKPVIYAGFFLVVICLNIFLSLNVFLQLMIFYIVLISSYKYIFDTSLYMASYGGLVVYILLSANQMIVSMLAFINSGLVLDYRDVFPSLPVHLYIVSLLICIGLIFLFNFCIMYPQAKLKNTRTSWLQEGPQHINLILSTTFLIVMSWNLRFTYSNSQNIGAISGMSEKIFILLLLVLFAFTVIIYIVNRSFVQPKIKDKE